MELLSLWLLSVPLLSNLVWADMEYNVSARNFPDPQSNFTACGRDKPSWICDPIDHLTEQQGDELDGIIASFRGAPRCLCDDVNICPATFEHLVMVAIVDKLTSHNRSDEISWRALLQYAEVLRDETWKMHQSGCSMFAVIVYDIYAHEACIVMEAHTFRWLPHYNMSDARPYVKKGQVFLALKAALQEIQSNFEDHTRISAGGIIGILLAVIVVVAFLCICVMKVKDAATEDGEFLVEENHSSPRNEARYLRLIMRSFLILPSPRRLLGL